MCEKNSETLKYEEMRQIVNTILKNFSIAGYDKEDLFLEGMLEAIEAQSSYNTSVGVKLSTYVYSRVKYKMYYMLRRTKAEKRTPEEIVTLETTLVAETGKFYGRELFVEGNQEQEYEDREFKEKLLRYMTTVLNDSEQVICTLMIEGYKTREISRILKEDPRKIGNKSSYIRRKLRQNFKNIEKS